MGQELHRSSVTVLPEQRMPPPWDDAECAGVPLAASGDSSDEQGFAAADSKGPADGPKTGDARELLPWPVEPLDLPPPTAPELLAEGRAERHDALLAAAQERRRQQEEAGVLLSRVVYDAVHFVPSSPERVPGRALLFESRFESGNLRRVIHVCENEYDLLLNWDHGTRGHTQWFLFAVRGAVQGESYRFNINNFCKGSSLCAPPPPRGGGGGGGGGGSPLTPTRACSCSTAAWQTRSD